MNTYIAIVSSSSIQEEETGFTCNATVSFESIVDSSDAPAKCWIAVAAPRDVQANFKIIGLLSGFTFSQEGGTHSATLTSCKWIQSFGLRNGIDTCPYEGIQQTLNELMDVKGLGSALRLGVNTERRIESLAAFEKELIEHTQKQANPAAFYSTTNSKCPECSNSTAYVVAEQQTAITTLTRGRYRKDGGMDLRYNSEFATTKRINRTLLCSSCRYQWIAQTNAGCFAVMIAVVSLPMLAYFI